MKKIFILPFLIPTVAFAVKIDANTKIQWNAIVVVAALHDVGLESHFDSNSDVALTYNRILEDLLNRKTFSATDAVSVCMQQCNKSSFLKEGRGQSGKKCPDICKNFGANLVTENNKGKWTVARIKSAIKPGAKLTGGKDYYIAENNSAFESCFSPCVFQNSTVVCCFDTCGGERVDYDDQTEVYTTACETQSNSNLFLYSFKFTSGKRVSQKLSTVDKHSTDANKYRYISTDFEQELEYKLKNIY